MAEQFRLFVGVALDAAWTDRLSEAADQLRKTLGNRVRWVRPELYHVTVVFLGNQPADSVPEIEEALTRAAWTVEPFSLRLLELRRLGGHDRGAIVAGVNDATGHLQALRRALDPGLRERGIRFDAKPLVPHITLGRPRNNAGPLDVPRLDISDNPPFQVGAVTLFQSD